MLACTPKWSRAGDSFGEHSSDLPTALTPLTLIPQDHIGFQRDTSNPAKDDNNESCHLYSPILPSNGGRKNLLGTHFYPPFFRPLTWWDPEAPLSNNGTEWVGGTLLPPLDQDVVNTHY